MAITIISNLTSNKFYPSQNPINVTVNSNNSGKCNFRFICDLYINGTKVFTDKLFPDPTTGYGFFQLSRVIQDYIKTSIPKTPYSNAINAIATTAVPTSAFSIQLKFGEEYDATVDCDGSINQYLNLQTSNTAFVFETAVDYEDFPTFNGNDYVMGTFSATTEFLTNSQREIEVTYNDTYFLDFIANRTISSTTQIRVTRYFVDGTTSTSYYNGGSLGNIKRYRIACGPYDLNKIADTTLISPLVSKYTIQLIFSYQQGISTIRLTTSETFTFKVKSPKPFRTRLAFVGLKGNIEHFTFYHRNREAYQIERKVFQKTLQSNYSGQWKYEVGDRGATVFGINAQQANNVATFCDQETSEWLYEMWLSPHVWTYIRPDLYSFRPFQDGLYVKYWVDGEPGLKAGDEVFSFSENQDFVNKFTVVSVAGNIVDFGLLYSIYGATMEGTCGYIQKKENWSILPAIISDNSIEIKQRVGRPIEYGLIYVAAYQKTTLKG